MLRRLGIGKVLKSLEKRVTFKQFAVMKERAKRFDATYGILGKPTDGEVLVIPLRDDRGQMVTLGYNHDDIPKTIKPGEVLVYNRRGCYIHLRVNGNIEVMPGMDGELILNGPVKVNGDMHVEGKAEITQTMNANEVADAQGPLSELRTKYTIHTHIDGQGKTTTTPTP